MFRHLIFKSEKPYLDYYLRRGNPEYLEALKVSPSPDWRRKLNQFEQYTEHMAMRAKNAGIPFVVTALPGHAQADLIAAGTWDADLNPYVFGQQLRAVIEKAGGTYIDILPCFQPVGNIHEDFYPMDQHLNAGGHRLLADILAKQLASSAVLRQALRPTLISSRSK